LCGEPNFEKKHLFVKGLRKFGTYLRMASRIQSIRLAFQ